MIQKKISLLVMALVLLVSGIFININANEGDDKDTVSLTVHKVWENLPEDFEVEGVEAVLLRNEEVVDTITLDDSNSWTYTWNDLEAYDEAEELYEYRVEELNVTEDFEVSYQTSEEAKEIEVTITNTYLEAEEPGASIDDMEEIVDLGDIETFSDKEDVPFSITYTLNWVIMPGLEAEIPESVEVPFSRETSTDSLVDIETVEFSAANNWTYTFENLERFNEEDEAYTYYINLPNRVKDFRHIWGVGRTVGAQSHRSSAKCDHSQTECNFKLNPLYMRPYWVSEGNTTWAQAGFDIIWENVPEGKELPNIEVALMQYNSLTNPSVWVEFDSIILDGSEDIPWTNFWLNLPFFENLEVWLTHQYKFEIRNIPEGYEVTTKRDINIMDGWIGDMPITIAIQTLVLTYIDEPLDPVSVTATKNWANLPQGKEVSGVEVALLRNGEEIETVVLNDTNNWTYTWDDLDPVDENNQPYEYTVEERNVSEDFDVSYEKEVYCAVLQDNEEDCNDIKVEITNTYIDLEKPVDPEKPIDPKEPEKPVNPEKPEEPELPNTGISQDISYLSGLMMIASGLLLVLVTKKRRLDNKS